MALAHPRQVDNTVTMLGLGGFTVTAAVELGGWERAALEARQ